MTSVRRNAASLLCVVLLLLVAAPLQARQARLIGKVVGPDGKPIAGVAVTTTSESLAGFLEQATTDGKGVFTIDFTRVNVVYVYTFEKEGYLRLRVEQKWTIEGTERHQFVLTPAPAGAAAVGTTPAVAPASSSDQAITAFNAGVLALKARDYDTARARFDEALSYDPYLRQAWAAQSELHLRQKRYREAAEAAEKAIALGFKDEAVLRVRWDAYRGSGDQEKAARAREELERAGRLGEEAKRIHNEAVALSKAGDDAGALAKFREALAVDPAFAPSLLGLATAALKAGQAPEAAAAAETLLKADPRNEQALRLRYNAALKLGNEALVVDALAALAAVDKPFARDSLFKLAQTAFDADRGADARVRLGKVLEVDPDHPRSHYLLGLVDMREGRTKEARAHLERFVALAPTDPDAATARSALAQLKP